MICGSCAGALELQCQHQAPDRMSRVCACCGIVRVKFAAEKRFSSLVFIASMQSPKVLCDSTAPQRTSFNMCVVFPGTRDEDMEGKRMGMCINQWSEWGMGLTYDGCMKCSGELSDKGGLKDIWLIVKGEV